MKESPLSGCCLDFHTGGCSADHESDPLIVFISDLSFFYNRFCANLTQIVQRTAKASNSMYIQCAGFKGALAFAFG